MELSSLRRVGGCDVVRGILGILFEGDIIPVRLRASCERMLSKDCRMEKCPRYRTGTLGSHKIHWDVEGEKI